MMIKNLVVSLTQVCFLKYSNEEGKYTVNNVKSSVLIFKLLKQRAIVDTRETTYQFRLSLKNLENHIGNKNNRVQY